MASTPLPSSGWTVTGQQETSDIGPQGTYVPGVRVTFRLENGTTGSVFVAQSDYTVENVRKAIVERADTMAGVHGLTSEG